MDLYESLPVAERAYYAEYGARDALVPVFSLAPAQRVAGVLGRLDQVRRLLAADIFRDSREARQLATDITLPPPPPQPLPDDT